MRRTKSGRRVMAERAGAGLAALIVIGAAAWGVLTITGPTVPKGDAHPPAAATATEAPSSQASGSGAVTASATEPSAAVPATMAPPPRAKYVVAWQPSHQNDTGAISWHEYIVCGDIVDRSIALTPDLRGVKAWDIRHRLTGSNNYRPRPSNTPAFDNEVAIANAAKADVFIAVHCDGGAPSGVLGEYLPGDAKGKRLCAALVAELVRKTGLPDRGLRAVRLYSLESARNKAEYRCLVEIGDNVADRRFLDSAAGRQKAAEAMASVLNRWP